MSAKSVSIFCRNRFSCNAWKNHLLNIKDDLEVRTFVYDEVHFDRPYYDDLIIIYPFSIKDRVMALLDPKAKVIVGKRTISLDKIYQLTDIPPGSDVVILNDTYEFCLDIIEELRSLGFDYYEYYPYDPAEIPLKPFDYAITCGEGHLMPDVKYCIDFGNRQVSVTTVAEILNYYNEGSRLDSYILNRYVYSLTNISVAFYLEKTRSESLRRQLEATISAFDEGVILINERAEILSSNIKAETILGANLNSAYFRKNFPEKWNSREEIEFFIRRDNLPLHVSIKPLSLMEEPLFLMTVSDISKMQEIEEKYRRYQKNGGLVSRYSFKDIFYRSETMASVVSMARKYARSDSSVLLIGESGTGKELFAHAIHHASLRKDGPFVAVNCGALSPSLLESELFGYEEGAFTGARKGGKAGLFETAHNGTLFLDEITDAALPIQQKLLRAIQEKEIIRVSGTKPIFVDVRIIAATNRDILSEVKKGAFRQDLFYRINVFTLRIPPLRERKEDVLPLFESLLALRLQKKKLSFPNRQYNEEFRNLLLNHPWPGNVREMGNLIEVIANGLELEPNYDMVDQVRQYWNMLYRYESLPSSPSPQESAVLPAESYENIEMNDDTREVFRILAALERDGKAPGRSAVYRYCRENDIPLTEQQIKLRIERLRSLGFLRKARGYGNIITDLGRRYLSSDKDRQE